MRWGAGMVFCTSDALAPGLSTALGGGFGKVLNPLRDRQPKAAGGGAWSGSGRLGPCGSAGRELGGR